MRSSQRRTVASKSKVGSRTTSSTTTRSPMRTAARRDLTTAPSMLKNMPRLPAQPRRRDAIQIGGSRVNASDLKGLQFAWRHKQLVLFLGAGISLASGIPAWKNLVLEMLFDQTEHARRLKG